MRCPKCGLTSFDYNDACPKCGRDLAPLREQLGLLNLAPQPLFLLAPLLGEEEAEGGVVEEQEGEKDFTFEQDETEDLGAYDSDSAGVREEGVSAEDMEEVATLEFEADVEDETEEQGIEMPSAGGIDFNISEEEPSLEIDGEEAETGMTLDFSDNDETLILEPEEMGLPLEIETETETEQESLDEEMESLGLGFDLDTEEEPPRTNDDELDLAALDLESEALDFSDIESDVDNAEEVPSALEKTEIRGFSDSDQTLSLEPDESSGEIKIETDLAEAPESDDDLSGLRGLDLEFAPEEGTSGDEGDLDLAGLSVEEEQVLTMGGDQGDDPGRIRSDEDDLNDLALHLEDETLIVEDTNETLILEDSGENESLRSYDSDDEDDLNEIELDFDDLELELEEDN